MKDLKPQDRGSTRMDDTDRGILNEIQSDFPITSRPFRDLGSRLGIEEDEVLERVGRLREKGVIRRIGGNFHSGRLDFSSTLCAARVPQDKIEDFVETVNSYPGVTHNYLRNNRYNIWFTFIAKDMKTIEESLQEISSKTGIEEIYSMPAVKTFKIKVDFDV